MQWNARPFILAFALVAAADGAQAQTLEPAPDAATPSGTSQAQSADARYDVVGYAAVQPLGAAALAASPDLLPESYAEVTDLGSGRTILVRIAATGAMPGDVVALSEGAARQLGAAAGTPLAVRVRVVRPSTEDQAALRSAGAAQPRIDSPPALLRALRLQLPAPPVPDLPLPPPPPSPAAVQVEQTTDVAPFTPALRKSLAHTPAKPVQGRYLVQVAALSSPDRAQMLAQKLKGFVKAGGGLYRVQLGPFATEAAAERARAEAVRAGFGDARRTTVR